MISQERSAILSRGINITRWFRFPPNGGDPAETYLSDDQLAALRSAGFTYVRLPVQPLVLQDRLGQFDNQRARILISVIRRIQKAELGVVIVPYLAGWDLQKSTDRFRLGVFWSFLAPYLATLDPAVTYAEVANEPILDDSRWQALQIEIVGLIRKVGPLITIGLTSTGWSAPDSIVQLNTIPDANVFYSFHFYAPTVLTSVGSTQGHALDKGTIAKLPFPNDNKESCISIRDGAPNRETMLAVEAYCGKSWGGGLINDRLAQVSAWAHAKSVTVIATEFGFLRDHEPSGRLSYLSTLRSSFEAFGIPWAIWGYDDSFGFGVDPSSKTSTLDKLVLKALGLEPGR